MNQYCYALVQIKDMETTYSYLSDDPKIKVGSYVLVPFGKTNDEKPGTVEDVRICTKEDAPFPPEKTKRIIRRISAEKYEACINEGSGFGEKDSDDDDDNKYAKAMAEHLEHTEVYDYDYLFRWACDHHEEIRSKRIMELVVRCYQLCAEQHMPLACLNLGTFYYNGTYLEHDYKKAAALYKIAADSGVPVGIRNLGYCYYYGRHQAVDYAKAYEYFSKGALLFDGANCLYKLGDMYRSGLAVEKNEKYAYLLYDRAMRATQENDEHEFCKPDIFLRFGECVLKGTGISVDAEKAHALLQLALTGLYRRRKTDPFVGGLIKNVKSLIQEAEVHLDKEVI